MLLMQHHQDGLLRRLTVIGIPMYTIGPFVDLMVKWESCSGVEWTIKRLKSLKVDLIRRRSGQEPLTWVRKNRNGDVRGLIGSLFRWADKSERNFSRCVQAFCAYTFYILPSVTEAQKKKFLEGINPEKGDGLSLEFLNGFSRSVQNIVRKREVHSVPAPLVTYQGSPEKKAPTVYGRSVPQDQKIMDEIRYFETGGGMHLYHRYQRLYKPLMQGVGSFQLEIDSMSPQYVDKLFHDRTVLGGEIHFIQEPGGKLRSIASPFRLHQEALRPLGLELYSVVKSLPWDCTFDQMKGIPHIQSALQEGRQVHSVDLSSATDHFPLRLQEMALKTILCESDWDYVNLFCEISRGQWRSPLGGKLQWTKGQPLGLYPSFAAFTLTHGLLLYHLSKCDYHSQYFVVGDDVVILEEKLFNDYVSMLDRMSCPWSSDKSISSTTLSEFAGKIITATGVIPQLKWRRMSDDNFLDICRMLGSRSRSLLNSRQKRVFDGVAHLCEPIGLNQSIPGDNLEKMVNRTLTFYRPVEKVLGTLLGLRRRLNQVVHSSVFDFNSDELLSICTTFDEKVKLVLSQTVFSNWDCFQSLGLESVSSLPSALGLRPRLPLSMYASTRRTTLDRYEALLDRRP